MPVRFRLPNVGGPGSRDAVLTRCLLPRPRPIFEPPDGVVVKWTVSAANYNNDPASHEVVSARIQEAFVDHSFSSSGAPEVCEIYSDGSGMASRLGPHATASGAAVLMLGDDVVPIASVQALVPRGLPQTAQAGEFLAAYLVNCPALEVRVVARSALELGQAPSSSFDPQLRVDCKGVVQMFDEGVEGVADFAQNHCMMY